MVFECQNGTQEAPKECPGGAKRGQEAPKRGPRASQEGSKRGPSRAQERAKRLLDVGSRIDFIFEHFFVFFYRFF